MSKYLTRVNMRLLSPAAISTGEEDGLVDCDILTDSRGFPFINGRRFKGLLKEYTEEVLEICGNAKKKQVIDMLFGEKGSNSLENGLLRINNLNLEDADKGKQNSSTKGKAIKRRFSSVLQQTAIDSDSETAKDKSLRRIRTVNEGLVFVTEIDCINEDISNLLSLAFLQFNCLGTRRNRGLGYVAFENNQVVNFEKATAQIKNLDPSGIDNNIQQTEQLSNFKESGKTDCLLLKIRLTDNLLLSQNRGEQNTVATNHFIEGRKLWGCFASYYLKKYKPGTFFTTVFHEGKIQFGPAFISNKQDVFYPAPIFWQNKKHSGDNTLINIFNNPDVITRKLEGYFHKNGDKIMLKKPRVNSSFHESRSENRVGGKSVDGGIFYYESLEAGQEFTGVIRGNSEHIRHFKEVFASTGNPLSFTLGRSKGTEYGRIEVFIENYDPGSDQKNEIPETFIISFTSPCIVYNNYLFAEPTVNILNRYIEPVGIITEKAATGHQHIQCYSGVLKGKTNLVNAFAPGSSFVITNNHKKSWKEIHEWLSKGVGEEVHQGYGSLQVFQTGEQPGSFEIEKTVTLQNEAHLVEDEMIQKNNALKSVKTGLKPSNHLLTRLIQIISTNEKGEVIEKILAGENNNRDKPVFKFLEKVKFWEKWNGNDPILLKRIYFTTLFNAYRLKNKKDERN
jgi:CRISPR/Cas system CSM-associated protein Csm3 (group 7 of RAMP superfamily)